MVTAYVAINRILTSRFFKTIFSKRTVFTSVLGCAGPVVAIVVMNVESFSNSALFYDALHSHCVSWR
jgi:hypothetical protein